LDPIPQLVAERRRNNAKGLAAFGLPPTDGASAYMRTVRNGGVTTVFTIGYEKRKPEDLIARLRDAGVEVLADIREKPISRRADYRGTALKALCDESGIRYQSWPLLGSTGSQREILKESGDIEDFHRSFRDYARDTLANEIGRLAGEVKQHAVALLCYERCHEECHRMVIADLIAERIGATVIAIL
jgi:uncharacterized protein (DUF488 family)